MASNVSVGCGVGDNGAVWFPHNHRPSISATDKFMLHADRLCCLSHSSLCTYPNPLHITHAKHQALNEARSIARRPMAQSLKDEREEIVVRCYLAQGDADRAVAETAGHDNPGKFRAMQLQLQFQFTEEMLNGFKSVVVVERHMAPAFAEKKKGDCILEARGTMPSSHDKSETNARAAIGSMDVSSTGYMSGQI